MLLYVYYSGYMVSFVVGQHHGVYITSCGCISMPKHLLMLGLWPATPTKPKLAFTIELMNTIHFLLRECQASLYDVTNLLRCIGKKQPQVCYQ